MYRTTPLTLTNATLHGNSAGYSGGGLHHDVSDPTSLSLQNVTITGNEADSDGNQGTSPYDSSSADSYAIFHGSSYLAHNLLEEPLTNTYFWLQAETACNDAGNWVRAGIFHFTLVAGS